MKTRIILILLISFFSIGKPYGQNNSPIHNDKKQDAILQKSHRLSDDEIKKVKTKKRAIVGVKVLNRHNAKFYYNNLDISYRESIKLVRKKFDNLIIIENRKTKAITITDKK